MPHSSPTNLLRLLLLSALIAPACAFAQTAFVGNLTGAQEVPPVVTAARGFGRVTLSADETTINVSLDFSGLGSNESLAHIHGPAAVGANAAPIFNLDPAPAIGTPAATISNLSFAVTPAQVADLRNGLWYFNVHSDLNGGGEIRGQIGPAASYRGDLNAAQEVPTNASTATGVGLASLNLAEDQLVASVSWSGLGSGQTLAHIHGQRMIGENGGVLFNLDPAPAVGGTTGTTGDVFFAITPAQVAQLKAGLHYFNVHSMLFGGGEIRGQLVPPGATILTARLDGGQEVPPVATTATGLGQVVLNAARDQIIASANYSGLSSAQTLTHIHGPAPLGVSAGVLFNLDPAPAQGGTTGRFDGISFAITPAQATDLESGLHYFNVHSMTNGGGEIRGQITSLDRIFANDFE